MRRHLSKLHLCVLNFILLGFVSAYAQESALLPGLGLEELMRGREKRETWTGLSTEKYNCIPYYNKNGTAKLKIQILPYDTLTGPRTANGLNEPNYVIHAPQNVAFSEIDKDGRFELNYSLQYPQIVYITTAEDFHTLFLCPGDSLEMYICYDEDKSGKSKIRFSPTLSESPIITLLCDSLLQTVNADQLYMSAPQEGLDAVMNCNNLLASKLDSALSHLPSVLGDLPISTYAKDIIASRIIFEIMGQAEDMRLIYQNKYNGAPINFKEFYAPYLRHSQQIFNNPLLPSTTWIVLNRFDFSPLWEMIQHCAYGVMGLAMINQPCPEPQIYDQIVKSDEAIADCIGCADSFVTQYVLTTNLVQAIKEESDSGLLKPTGCLVPDVLSLISNRTLARFVTDAFAQWVMNENPSPATTSDATADAHIKAEGLFAELIRPYIGNVLFVDFWSMSCGPCRAGMKRQISLLEKYADMPFKAVYVNCLDQQAKAEKWMAETGIRGEHVYVSSDEWARLQGELNFFGLPFGVIVDKNGCIRSTNVWLEDSPSISIIDQLLE